MLGQIEEGRRKANNNHAKNRKRVSVDVRAQDKKERNCRRPPPRVRN